MKMRAAHDWLAVIAVVLVCFAGAVMFSPVGRAAKKKNTDAFLDAPLPPGFVPHLSSYNVQDSKSQYSQDCVSYDSFQDRLDALEQVAPRRVILPDGFTDFLAKVATRSDWKKGDELFSNERNGCAGGGNTYRAFMTQSFQALGLGMKYDPERDALVTDYPWHRQDSRSNQELLQILKSTQPVATDPLNENVDADSWRAAFDSLLSKPENFSSAWKLRYLDDVRGRTFSIMNQPGVVFWSGELPDEKSKQHFVVVTYHSGNLPRGLFCCYVFDAQGRFEYGAALDGAYRCDNVPHVELQPSGKGLTIYYDEGGHSASGALNLEREGVMIRDSDVRNGSCLGVPIYRTEMILN